MTTSEVKQRIAKLRATIDHHRYLYHVLDTQEISDAALDSLKHELAALESQLPDLITPHSPTQRVGGLPLAAFKKVVHRSPMLSMEDIFMVDELEEWEARLKRFMPRAHLDYFAEIKMDGLAVSLLYKDGVFTLGATRGDGKVGEDVTQNLRTIEAVPLSLRVPSEKEINAFLKKHGKSVDGQRVREMLTHLKGDIEVRGEVFMTKKSFDRLNAEQERKGLPLFANPRNAAAGSIRQLDPKVAASRNLDFFGYALMDEERFGITTHEQSHQILALLGVKTNRLDAYCADRTDIAAYYQKIQNKRESLPYWTDGIVVGINTIATFNHLGVVGKTPRGMIAYKFPAEQVTTILRDVVFQVGRTGALTPVGTFDPVVVAGTTVTHATLHNVDEIKRLDVRIGDTVIIEKAGDIIPKVVRVLAEMRTGNEKKIIIPKRCPICTSPVIRKAGEVAIMCSNKNCFAKQKEQIIHFVSRKCVDIDGLGEKIVEQLINAGLVHDAADLYALRVGDLEPLERFAEKSAENLIEALDARRIIELPRFLNALGIRHVGEETAFDLARHFGTLEKIEDASFEELIAVPHIGDVVAKSICEYFGIEGSKQLIAKFLKNGVTIKSFHVQKAPSQHLSGKTFVLTGSLSSMTREQAQEKIRDRGGNVSSSVSRTTDYVVVGEDPGSKAERAKKLGVPILAEGEFLEMLGTDEGDSAALSFFYHLS